MCDVVTCELHVQRIRPVLVKVLLKSYRGRSWFLQLNWARCGFPRKNIVSTFIFPHAVLFCLTPNTFLNSSHECSEINEKVERHNSPPHVSLCAYNLARCVFFFFFTIGP